jgi:short-subunit dehydrogenase
MARYTIEMIDIKHKWALVTGASRGIGKEISRALHSRGCNLVLHSRSVQHTEELAEQLSTDNIRVVSVEADLSVPAEVAKLVSEIKRQVPSIDILYNNAGVMTPYRSDVWDIPDEDFRHSFEVNVLGPVRLCNAFIPSMIERGWGRVLNINSGIQLEPQLAAYAISKAALKKYVQDLVPVLEGSGVAVNLLDPDWLRTDLGGQNAPNAVDSVIPGALVPVLVSQCVSGFEFKAQDYAGMNLEGAVSSAEQKLRLS